MSVRVDFGGRRIIKKKKYKLRLYTMRPDAVFRSYSNVLEFGVPFKEVVVPNVITPNGDDINDKVRIKYLYLYPGSAFTIFNRWGQPSIIRMITKTIGMPQVWNQVTTITCSRSVMTKTSFHTPERFV